MLIQHANMTQFNMYDFVNHSSSQKLGIHLTLMYFFFHVPLAQTKRQIFSPKRSTKTFIFPLLHMSHFN